MKKIILFITVLTCMQTTMAQKAINDESMRYQQERMVFKQWDRDKFTPKSGFLGLNPYYWLTWGLHPNYPKTDLRPLSPWGPQTQRLGLVMAMNSSSGSYKLESDTLRNTAMLEIANQSGIVSAADPLWLLYYSKELKPVLENSQNNILNPLPPPVRTKVISDGLYSWYKNELDNLKQRIEGARNVDMDRGARILAYHRMLLEYRTLEATWATRTATSQKNLEMTMQQDNVKAGIVNIGSWTPESDVQIAKKILQDRKF